MNLVCAYKHKIGFKGPLLVEPKPRDTSKLPYDFDSSPEAQALA
jgi:xylose isomerase